MKSSAPPPDPFAQADAALVARVARGEIRTDEALALSAHGRLLACLKRARGLGRAYRALEVEATRILEDMQRTRAAELDALDAAYLYAQHARVRGGHVRRRKAREEREAAPPRRLLRVLGQVEEPPF